jgi:hypothetical protein
MPATSAGMTSRRDDANNKKAPRKTAGLLLLDIVKEDVPSLADLAATYSSKP